MTTSLHAPQPFDHNKESTVSFRCISAFATADEIYANGAQIEDGDPVLGTHADHFAKVEEPHLARAVEQAVAVPGGMRSVSGPLKKAPAKKAAAQPPKSPTHTEEN